MTREMGLRLQRSKSKVQSFVHSNLPSGKHVGIEDTEVARILLESFLIHITQGVRGIFCSEGVESSSVLEILPSWLHQSIQMFLC